MKSYQFKPDITVKLSPRITKSTAALIRRVCKRHEMFEADVLRFCLEAIAPEAARRGGAWLLLQVPNLKRVDAESLSSMITVRTSRKVKGALDKLTHDLERRPKLGYDPGEAGVLRFCYLAILPVALRDGFAPIMRMREKNLRGP